MLKAASTKKKITLPADTKKKGLPLRVQAAPSPGKTMETPDLLGTVKHYMLTGKATILHRRKASKAGISVIFLIDSTGSMVREQQIAHMKGIIAETLSHYKHRRLQYAAVALSQGTAQLISAYTTDSEQLLAQIASLPSGGKTNLKAGFQLVQQLHRQEAGGQRLYIFTDGRINAGGSFQDTVTYYKQHLRHLPAPVVVDHESGFVKLGMAQKLATAIGATYLNL